MVILLFISTSFVSFVRSWITISDSFKGKRWRRNRDRLIRLLPTESISSIGALLVYYPPGIIGSNEWSMPGFCTRTSNLHKNPASDNLPDHRKWNSRSIFMTRRAIQMMDPNKTLIIVIITKVLLVIFNVKYSCVLFNSLILKTQPPWR